MLKDDIIRKQLSRGLEMPEKWASGKRQNRMVPQSSGFGTVGPVFSPWSNQSLEESPSRKVFGTAYKSHGIKEYRGLTKLPIWRSCLARTQLARAGKLTVPDSVARSGRAFQLLRRRSSEPNPAVTSSSFLSFALRKRYIPSCFPARFQDVPHSA